MIEIYLLLLFVLACFGVTAYVSYILFQITELLCLMEREE